MRQVSLAYAVMVVAALAGAWLLFVSLPRWYGAGTDATEEEAPVEQPDTMQAVKATLFYISEDGMRLVGVEREIPYGETTTEQARRITEAQLTGTPHPLASAVPDGTTLRAIFVTERGDAFVDLSREVSEGHSGGSLEELFTVYAIVNALTMNLPAITAVQILVEGREVDTLAGHVDLRRPLERNLKWVEQAPDQDDRAGISAVFFGRFVREPS